MSYVLTLDDSFTRFVSCEKTLEDGTTKTLKGFHHAAFFSDAFLIGEDFSEFAIKYFIQSDGIEFCKLPKEKVEICYCGEKGLTIDFENNLKKGDILIING